MCEVVIVCNDDKRVMEQDECILLQEKVKCWWLDLQRERRCNSTHSASKIVNKASIEVQEKIKDYIAGEINSLIVKSYQSKEISYLQLTCNAINGCFDNFPHAAAAVKASFVQILFFIDLSIEISHIRRSRLDDVGNSMSKVLDLIHSCSRILVLLLKLQRSKMVRDDKYLENVDGLLFQYMQESHFCKGSLKELLFDFMERICKFFAMDDVSMDTKNNFAMSSVLIKELLSTDDRELIEFNEKFIQTIPTVLEESSYKINLLKFLMSNAIINAWSVNIISSDATAVYLRFFINLCESYSSETPVIVNSCRTLLLLVKHECFQEYMSQCVNDVLMKDISKLLSCILMLIEHPVPCVRHSARDFLQVLATHAPLQQEMISSVFELPLEKRSRYIGVSALANEMGSQKLISAHPDLSYELLFAMKDPTIVSHVTQALESVIINHELASEDVSKWCELWIVPLVESLSNVMPIVAADVEKTLEKTFKKFPAAPLYIIKKWGEPQDSAELRNILTCMKISHKQGFTIKKNSDFSSIPETGSRDLGDNMWKCIISEKLLYLCLHHGEDDIRISAFSLIIEGHRSTEIYSQQDFRLLQYFLRYNLNNQQPSTRQRILGLIKKMLLRFAESKAVLGRKGKTTSEQDEKIKSLALYDDFQLWLDEFCFHNIFIGCNFNRLNTVLNILKMSFEMIARTCFLSSRTNDYWEKLLIVLESSYEENKALAVSLSKNLDYRYLSANTIEDTKMLYGKAFDLCSHMEPPDVLTGCYLLQTLFNMPSAKDALKNFLPFDNDEDDVRFMCVKILTEKLKEEITNATLDLMTAAMYGPMYGNLFTIRLILQSVQFSEFVTTIGVHTAQQKNTLRKWSEILNKLIDLSFLMSHIVSCVVNSSSPEGHLPMDFQTDFKNLIPEGLSNNLNRFEQTEEKVQHKQNRDVIPPQKLTKLCYYFNVKFDDLTEKLEKSPNQVKDHLDDIHIMLKESELIIGMMKDLEGDLDELSLHHFTSLLSTIKSHRIHLLKLMRSLSSSKTDIRPTAQVLLLCSWRSIKEACLFLGDLVCKMPIEMAIDLGILTEETILRIGERLRTLLCEIKHRGAFEQAYIGFTQLVSALWKCSGKNLNSLPVQWLEEIISQLEFPLEEKSYNFCSTRRSAGLPFMVQAIISTEVQSIKSPVAHCLQKMMESLLKIAESKAEELAESRIHSLNILRALFKHAQLGDFVAPYIARALMVTIRGSRAATWSERNSASLLFSSLITRIFGVARSRDAISKKNRMTSRTFFQRYPELYDFLLSEIKLASVEENDKGHLPQPSLYLVLLVLGRLYPSPSEDSGNIDLSVFLPYVSKGCWNATMKIRELAARAVVPLVSHDRLLQEIDDKFSLLAIKTGLSQNLRHGLLLQISLLIMEASRTLNNMCNRNRLDKANSWIQMSKWMLQLNTQESFTLSFTVLNSYVKVLQLLLTHWCGDSESLSPLGFDIPLPDMLEDISTRKKHQPGLYLFVENFCFLKLDIIARRALSSTPRSSNDLCQFLMSLFDNPIIEVQAIPLRFLLLLYSEEFDADNEDFDVFGVTAVELSCLNEEGNVTRLRDLVTGNHKMISYMSQKIQNLQHNAHLHAKVILRLWVIIASRLLHHKVVSIQNQGTSSLDSVKELANSGDNTLASSGILCLGALIAYELSEDQFSNFDMWREFVTLLRSHSTPENDVKRRMAVAQTISFSWKCFLSKKGFQNVGALPLWLVPFRLISDDDPIIRKFAMELVPSLQEAIPRTDVMMETEPTSPCMTLLPLRAQEYLLDCYINIFLPDCLDGLILLMIMGALSSWMERCDESDHFEETGVFEKGNPNPFCEDLSLSAVFCQKLDYLHKKVNMQEAVSKKLDVKTCSEIRDILFLTNLNDNQFSIIDLIASLNETVGSERFALFEKNEFSAVRKQLSELKKSLGMSDVR